MAAFGQYTYIFVIGTLFAFLDAWKIGANDVANSWATSAWSRSATHLQAMILGAIMGASGAIGAGARVTDTIRTKIVSPSLFNDNPALLMLGMLCAVLASSVFLTVATRLGIPVSTTHSVLGGVIGMGIATVGADDITWIERKNGKFQSTGGVVAVVLAWIVAPAIAGGFAAVIFLVRNYGVFRRRNPVRVSLCTIPFCFGVTASLLCMLVVTKGGRINNNLSSAQTAGIIVGAGAAFALLVTVFLLPWIYRKVVLDNWQLPLYHVPLGPLLLCRGDVPAVISDVEGDLEPTHLVGDENKVEYIFGFLRVMTAATASFTLGANDVANAIGPYTTIYEIWKTGAISAEKTGVPDWILGFAGGAIVIGLWTYGYSNLKNLRNRPALNSWRGFSRRESIPIELGSAIAVIIATQQSLPVSTTQCIAGATLAVGLCSGTWRGINWRMVAWIYLGWLLTIPVAGLISGSLMAFIIHAPNWHTTA